MNYTIEDHDGRPMLTTLNETLFSMSKNKSVTVTSITHQQNGVFFELTLDGGGVIIADSKGQETYGKNGASRRPLFLKK